MTRIIWIVSLSVIWLYVIVIAAPRCSPNDHNNIRIGHMLVAGCE